MVTLPPLFPMTFFFSYGVNPYYARPVISPFAFFSYSFRPHVLLVFSQGRISKNSGRHRRCHDMGGIPHIPWRHPFPDRLQCFHSSPDGENPPTIYFKSDGFATLVIFSFWFPNGSFTVHIVARCSYIVKKIFSSVWFSLSTYQAAVNWLPIAFALCGVLSSSTLSTLHYRWIVFGMFGAVCLAAFRPCHP